MNIAICEDNRTDLENEYNIITKVMTQKNIVYSMKRFMSPEELMDSDETYDIVFLDIEMPDVSGLEVARNIRKKNKKCLFIFVTNHDNYIDDAFDEYAFRFWTKPIDRTRLEKGIESALRRMEAFHKMVEINVDRIKTGIEISKILFICADNKKTRIVTTENEYVVCEPFKSVKSMVQSPSFYETHASYYVNLNYIDAYDRSSVICGTDDKKYELHMSRRKYAAFKQYFINWMGDQI